MCPEVLVPRALGVRQGVWHVLLKQAFIYVMFSFMRPLHGMPRYIVKHYFWACLFPEEISIWIHGLGKADYPSQCRWASYNLLKVQIGQKVEEGWNFLSLIELGHGSLADCLGLAPSVSLVLRPLDFDWHSWVSSLQMVGHGTSQAPYLCESVSDNKSLPISFVSLENPFTWFMFKFLIAFPHPIWSSSFFPLLA